MNEHQIRTRKSYTPEFKEQAVRLALELGNIEAASLPNSAKAASGFGAKRPGPLAV